MEQDIWGFYDPGRLYKPPFCDKELSKVRRYLEGRSIYTTMSHMKAQDHSNPPPAPPPASIPPSPRGVTGTSGPGAVSLPPPPPARNTSNHRTQQCQDRCHYLPVAAINSLLLILQTMQWGGSRDSTPSPARMDISHHLPWQGAASQPSEWTSYIRNHQPPPQGVWQQHNGPPMSPPPNNWYQTGQPHHQPPTATVMRLDQMMSLMNLVQPGSSSMSEIYTVNLTALAMTLRQGEQIPVVTSPGSGSSSKRWVWHQDQQRHGNKHRIGIHIPASPRTSIILTSQRKASA